ncbi:hypothetical protein [Moraxella sp. ZY200743]|uniref:hypothetical protein n=1 Tax=Moraxella sp. ZY200743 TaxID=2911970 RepID=UPI003D7CD843
MSKTLQSQHRAIHSKSQAGSTAQILALFLVALVFTSLVVAFVGYRFGHRQGLYTAKYAAIETGKSTDVSTLSAENIRLKQQIDAITKERDISLNNIERLNTEQNNLEIKNLQLTQVNDLLKSSVAAQGGVALKVIGSEIVALPENIFEYRFDVAMIDVSGRAVSMIPRLTLLNATSMVEIPLEPSNYQIDGVANIRGRFVMPKGFVPRQMKLELIAGEQKIQQLYNWRVGKIIGDAPTSLSEVGSINKKTNQKQLTKGRA